jgi:endogenous inhibitor of DNA gyrase (YacG/DUF329 family)
MGMVIIKCPVTGQPVPTGLVMDKEEFGRASLVGNILRCPACGRMHEWTREQAQLVDLPPEA